MQSILESQQKTCFVPECYGILNLSRQFFVFRDSILQQAIEKASTKIEHKYSDLSIRKATLTVLRILLTEITLVPKNADTLFSVQKMKTSINFFAAW
jgi:hypothetical protein